MEPGGSMPHSQGLSNNPYPKKKILTRIFGSKRDKNRNWRELHNEELHSLYRSPNAIRIIKYRNSDGRVM